MPRPVLATSLRRPATRWLAPALVAALAIVGGLAPAPAAGAEAGEIATFVWEAFPPRAGRRTKPDRLLGTMHVPLSHGRRLPRRVEAMVRGSSRFVMEVDLGTADAELVRRYAAIDKGQDLRALMPAASWPKLVKLTQPVGLDEAALRGLDPWYVALTFLPTPGDQGALMDSKLRGLAEGAKVPVAFLERAEDQFRALDGVAMAEDVAQLVEVVDDPAKPLEEMQKLERAYLAGDLAAVQGYLFEADRVRAYPDFYEKVFYQRNRRWLPQLETIMRRDQAFVAVGLGHLLGERGLLAGLAKKGWKVRRAL